MGCDIHGVIEYHTGHRWWAFAILHLDRNYEMYSHLAGVRSYGPREAIVPLVAPRGYPPDLSCRGKSEALYFISTTTDDHYINPETAKQYLSSGWSQHYGKHYITNPDYHSPGWVTTSELQRILDDYDQWCKANQVIGQSDMIAVHAMMAQLELLNGADCVRFVFWFDN